MLRFSRAENRIELPAWLCTTSECVSDRMHSAKAHDTTAEEVNAMLKEASENELKGITWFSRASTGFYRLQGGDQCQPS
ncbi:hypothetical protein O9929_22395 [Vibrio lentus]|nr:hypothetical protein [Vibrio lentus]